MTTATPIRTPEVGRTITVRPTHRRHPLPADEVRSALGDALASFPVPEIDAIYEVGGDASSPDQNYEPLFAEDFDSVIDEAIAEVQDEVAQLLIDAVNRRLPWSTTHTGWRIG